jgi:hypothetical protein
MDTVTGTIIYYDNRNKSGVVKLQHSGMEIRFSGKFEDTYIIGDIISFNIEAIEIYNLKNIKRIGYVHTSRFTNEND